MSFSVSSSYAQIYRRHGSSVRTAHATDFLLVPCSFLLLSPGGRARHQHTQRLRNCRQHHWQRTDTLAVRVDLAQAIGTDGDFPTAQGLDPGMVDMCAAKDPGENVEQFELSHPIHDTGMQQPVVRPG